MKIITWETKQGDDSLIVGGFPETDEFRLDLKTPYTRSRICSNLPRDAATELRDALNEFLDSESLAMQRGRRAFEAMFPNANTWADLSSRLKNKWAAVAEAVLAEED